MARRELTAYAANLAVSLAAKQMKVDAATDQALVREFAKELSPGPGGGAKTGQDGD
jgi:F0F1-type ATP synthase membrane subunit b/b'